MSIKENPATCSEYNESSIEPLSTSHLISTKSITYNKTEFTEYVIEQEGTTWGTVFSTIIFSMPAAKLEALLLTYVGIKLSWIIYVADVVFAIKAAINTKTLREMNAGLVNHDYIVITSRNYEWLSGSGNHAGYYSEISYSYM